ncbi:18.1 kDa class I heat shock protein-like [Diospyros lotus]|uniref:18.1 kDa class I heat shock protein-like n=1 Tax=Diospyros lotus TaxID=55363 RepID=UPI002258C912|nr:18.1 kDa class I heat shock protein-like [Diospyros lotus]
MENVWGRKIAADRKSYPNPTVEELMPPFSWADDPSDNYLIVDLPGFKKEELSVQVDEHGDIQVKGRRIANENKTVQLDQTFRMPPNSNTHNISARFDSGILYVIVPKEVKKEDQDPRDEVTANDEKRPDEPKADAITQDLTEKRENDENATATREEGFQPPTPAGMRRRPEDGLQASVAEMLSDGKRIVVELLIRKKEIVITAVLAFSLGVFVSQKFQSNVGIGCD